MLVKVRQNFETNREFLITNILIDLRVTKTFYSHVLSNKNRTICHTHSANRTNYNPKNYYIRVATNNLTYLKQELSNFIHFSAVVKEQAGKNGSTAHASPTVFSPF